MLFKNICTKSQINLIQKYNLDGEIETILNEFVDGRVELALTFDTIQNLIQSKKQELQKIVFDQVKEKEFLNPHKMTMIDPIAMQSNLATMLDNQCEVVIVEVSSQGLQQNRHIGLGKFDYVSFLNLYPEHIESHGSFENYKNAKAILFHNLKNTGTAIVNGDDSNSNYMLERCPSESLKVKVRSGVDYGIEQLSPDMFKSFWLMNKDSKQKTSLNSYFIADFEIENAVIASKIANQILVNKYNVEFDNQLLTKNYYQIPGRMEWVVFDNKIV